MKNKKYNVIVVFVFLLVILGIYKCPFKYVFGISCPTCGITRAVFYALHLNFNRAFYYHLAWPFVMIGFIVYILIVFGFLKFNEKYLYVMYIIGFLNLLYYFYRLFSESAIVNINFVDSFIYKIYYLLFH